MTVSDGSEDREDGASDDDEESSRLAWLGLGGILSLCCVFAAPTGAAAVGGTAAGTTAAAGGGPVQIAVAASTVAALWLAFRVRAERSSNTACDANPTNE